MKTKYYIVILSALLLFCCVLSVFLLRSEGGATHAQIYSGGTLVNTVDLRIDQEFTVSLADGSYNVITVQGGKIAVTEASCPDQYCARRGFCNGGAQIVCLPNSLIIRFVEDAEVDFAVG